MSCWIKVSLVSGCLAATFTIVLAISVVYIFDVEKDNVVTGECIVQTCNVFYTQCPVTTCSGSGSNRRCTTYEEGCFIATIIFTLNTTLTIKLNQVCPLLSIINQVLHPSLMKGGKPQRWNRMAPTLCWLSNLRIPSSVHIEGHYFFYRYSSIRKKKLGYRFHGKSIFPKD